MSEDQGKEEEKFDFTSEGEELGYISLDQAVLQARQLAQEDGERYQPRLGWDEIVWSEVSSEQREDTFRIVLQFRRPSRGVIEEQTGEEEFVFDLAGSMVFRQVLVWPEGGESLEESSSSIPTSPIPEQFSTKESEKPAPYVAQNTTREKGNAVVPIAIVLAVVTFVIIIVVSLTGRGSEGNDVGETKVSVPSSIAAQSVGSNKDPISSSTAIGGPTVVPGQDRSQSKISTIQQRPTGEFETAPSFKPYDTVVGVIGPDPDSSSLIKPASAIAASDGRIFVLDQSMDNYENSIIRIFDKDGIHLKNVEIHIQYGTFRSMNINDLDSVSVVGWDGDFVRLNPDGSIFMAGESPERKISTDWNGLQNVTYEAVLGEGIIIASFKQTPGSTEIGILKGSHLTRLMEVRDHSYAVTLIDEQTVGLISASAEDVSFHTNSMSEPSRPFADRYWGGTRSVPSIIGGLNVIYDFAATKEQFFVLTEFGLFKTSLASSPLGTNDQSPWELVTSLPKSVDPRSRIALSIGNDGNIYLADPLEKRILIIDAVTSSVREFTTAKSRDSLSYGLSMATDPTDDSIWIQMTSPLWAVTKYSNDLEIADRLRAESQLAEEHAYGSEPLIRDGMQSSAKFGEEIYLGGVTANGELVTVEKTPCDPNCHYFVRIRDSMGQLKREFGGYGEVEGKFNSPYAPQLWLNSERNKIYAYEPGRMQVFDLDGLLKSVWWLPEIEAICGFTSTNDLSFLAISGGKELVVVDSIGTITDQITVPGLNNNITCGPDDHRLTMDKDRNLFLAIDDTVYIFTSAGEALSQINDFTKVSSLEFDNKDQLWLTSTAGSNDSPSQAWGKAIKISQAN